MYYVLFAAFVLVVKGKYIGVRSYSRAYRLLQRFAGRGRGASYHIKGNIYVKACVQSVLTYGTETWAMKKLI